MTTVMHCCVSVDIDRFTDAKLRKDWLPMFSDFYQVNSVPQLRALCRDARNSGQSGFSFDWCPSPGPDGTCQGHEEE